MNVQDFIVGLVIVLIVMGLILIFSGQAVPIFNQGVANLKCIAFGACQ